jgi:hypothetical protein
MADTLALGASALNSVQVRVLSWVPILDGEKQAGFS